METFIRHPIIEVHKAEQGFKEVVLDSKIFRWSY